MKGKTVLLILAVVVIAFIIYRICARPPEPESEPPPFWKDSSFLDDLGKTGRNGLKGIVVVAPASGLHSEESVKKAHEIAKSMGIAFPAEAMDEKAVPYTANSDEIRLDLLQKALADPDVEVLWAFRGGYGSSRLLAALAEMPRPPVPKTLVGYSDMTFLHAFLQNEWGWRTIHGGMFWELPLAGSGKEEDNFRLLAGILSGWVTELDYAGLKPFNQEAKDLPGPVEGVLCGGNLTCVAAGIGTPWAVRADGKILVLEDRKEQGYKLDRMLTQMKDAGLFAGAGAIVLGDFTEGDAATEFSLARFAGSLAIPVFRSDLFGHGAKNRPLVFNSPAVLEKRGEGDDSLFSPHDRGGAAVILDDWRA